MHYPIIKAKEYYHEARLLASMIADIKETDAKMMDKWVKDFDSWDVCDMVMLNLFRESPIAWDKAVEWSKRKPEFERRAGFALMACLAVKSKKSDDSEFDRFIPCIIKAATDERNFVRKAVNWVLRQIGKRNIKLNTKFIQVAEKIAKIDSKSAKWIAADAIRELRSEGVRKNLNR